MAPSLWNIRSKSSHNSHPDLNVVYKDLPHLFTMRVQHGGIFSKSPGRRYMFGKLNYVDCVDIDEFSVYELDIMFEELGYGNKGCIYYHYCIPGLDLDCGLLPLGNEEDVIRLSTFIAKNKEIRIYSEHGSTTLNTYQMSPIKVVIEEIEETPSPEAQQLRCIFAGNDKYQVTCVWNDQFVVNIRENSCTCRKWELSGMPCKHAVAVIWDMIQHGKPVERVEFWVHECYWLSTWQKMYKVKVDPINGRDMWPKSPCPTTIIPPNHKKQVGRPKKKRVRGADEVVSQVSQVMTQGSKLTRKFLTVTCRKCHNKGHNSRSCKGQRGEAEGSNAAGNGNRTMGKGVGV